MRWMILFCSAEYGLLLVNIENQVITLMVLTQVFLILIEFFFLGGGDSKQLNNNKVYPLSESNVEFSIWDEWYFNYSVVLNMALLFVNIVNKLHLLFWMNIKFYYINSSESNVEFGIVGQWAGSQVPSRSLRVWMSATPRHRDTWSVVPCSASLNLIIWTTSFSVVSSKALQGHPRSVYIIITHAAYPIIRHRFYIG